MKNTSKSYKELGTPYFKETFELLDEVFRERQIPYYLIGANAIALLLLKDGIKPSRGTRDIDFAVMISSRSEYKEFSDELNKKGFEKVAAPWTFRHPKFDTVIDVLPFGEIEETYTENFDHRTTDLHVLGFKEVLSDSAQIWVDETLVNIPTLPGFILLKLTAWSDRPEDRGNDLGDILSIISSYYDSHWDFILDDHGELLDLLGDEGKDDERLVAARVLGREAAAYLQKSERLRERILEVLDKNINDQFNSDIARQWAAKLDKDMTYTLSLLEAFLTGIKERL
jgi:predicted nucleotidyltransferase